MGGLPGAEGRLLGVIGCIFNWLGRGVRFWEWFRFVILSFCGRGGVCLALRGVLVADCEATGRVAGL